MSFLTNFILFFINVFTTCVTIYTYVVIASCIISWVNADPYNPIVRIINGLTEPALRFIRRYLPFVVISGLDLSPVVLIIGLQFINQVIVRTLLQLL